jgi:nitrogen regulatory protein P-II 1
MKKIEAILQHSKFNEVQHALLAIGVDLLTVCEVKGFSPQNRHVETYRSKDHTVDYLPKIKIDLVVMEQKAEQALKIILDCANSGKPGGDKVFISDVKEAGCLVPA